MKIIFKEGDKIESNKIILEDESFSMNGFICLSLSRKEEDKEYEFLGEIDLNIKDLYYAVKSFYDKYKEEEKTENKTGELDIKSDMLNKKL